MKIHTPHTDTRNFKPFANVNNETVPKHPIFSADLNDEVSFDTADIIKYPLNRTNLIDFPIDETGRLVLGAIASYEFMTNKMLLELLKLESVDADEKTILRETERLRKTGLIHSFRFTSDTRKSPSLPIHCLTKSAGESAVKNMDMPVDVINYNMVIAPEVVKKKLASNQLIFSFLKRYGSGVRNFEKSLRICAEENGEKAAVKPSVMIEFNDDSVLLYEVVRRERFWESTLTNKLERYKKVFDSWDKCDFKGEKPALIMCCEDEEHALDVKKLIQETGVDAMFTYDLLLFADNFNKHIFSVGDNDEIIYYQLMNENKEAV